MATEGLDYNKSRRVGYASTKPTAPAFTWPKSRERIRDDPGPGPGEYNPNGDGFIRGIGFGSSTRYKLGTDEVPGPGNYGIPRDPTTRSYPSFSFRGVTPRDIRANLPGPGAYEAIAADRLSTRASTSAFSISFKLEDPSIKERRPGPQAYNLKLDSSKPAVSLKFRHEKFGKDAGPGPLEYSDRVFLQQVYCPGSCTKKGFSFGVKTKLKTTADVTPGPIYKIGVTTLGIAAAVPMTDKEINQIAVL